MANGEAKRFEWLNLFKRFVEVLCGKVRQIVLWRDRVKVSDLSGFKNVFQVMDELLIPCKLCLLYVFENLAGNHDGWTFMSKMNC